MICRSWCFGTSLSLAFCLLLVSAAWAADEAPTDAPAPAIPTLYVIGDSTAASYPEDRAPLAGWAMVLQDYFDADRIRVENRARSGRSSKSFLEEGAWAPIHAALQPGDYVFIQFGHNDANKTDASRFTDPETTYKEFLTRYVEETRTQGAMPILLTPINRCTWDADTPTRHRDTMGGYPDAVRALAAALEVPLIDLHQLTSAHFNALGPDETRKLFLCLAPGASPNYPEGKEDTTHLQTLGAHEVAKLAVEAIRRQLLPMATSLR